MTEHNRRRRDTTPLNGPDPDDEALVDQLMGNRSADEQGTGVFDASSVDGLGEVGDVAQYLGEVEAGVHDDLPSDGESLELLTELELRDDETDDAYIAAEEGVTYVPPIDPPTVPSDNLEGAEVAAGFGVSALDEPYDSDHHGSFELGDDEMVARVREALRADSATTEYADRIAVSVRNGVVTLRGRVLDLEDSDNIAAVAGYIEGVVDVIDELELREQGR